MNPDRITHADVVLVVLTLCGAALTVIGGLGTLFRDGERSSVSLGIGLGLLFPLVGIIVLRLLAKYRDGHDNPP